MSLTKIGFIGLGQMGMPMAKSLVRGGFPLTVYDIRQEAIEEMKALGAGGAGSPREVSEKSDVIFSMVWDIPQTEEVIFGKNGVWEGIKTGSTIIISSTIGPGYCRKLYARAKGLGVSVIDCCVTGRDPSGENRPLTMMIGGDENIVEQHRGVFEALGKNMFYLGGIGSGQAYKLVHNMIAKYTRNASRDCLIEGLNLGLKAGLDLQKMVEVMCAGAAARSMQSLGFKPGLETEEIIKIVRAPSARPPGTVKTGESELAYAMEMAREIGAKTPMFRLIDELDMPTTYDSYYKLMEQNKT